MNKPVCVYKPTRMKHIDTRVVPMQLKNKITPMKKVFTLAVMLIAIAFLNITGSNFPYILEWREGNLEGSVIKSGELLENLSAEPKGDDPRILENLEAGTYYLITYDSSVNCKKVITQTILK